MNDVRRLFDEAREVAERAYAPYSNFRVGAVVIAEDGRKFTGTNVENAAYGSGICAETSAMVAAASAGVRSIDTVAVACLDGGECTPCGNCRQIMREFGVKRVIVQNDEREPVELTFEELLPRAFGPESLETDG